MKVAALVVAALAVAIGITGVGQLAWLRRHHRLGQPDPWAGALVMGCAATGIVALLLTILSS
jgi:hypothetical protein